MTAGHVHPARVPWPVDPAMRPLVRAVMDAPKGLHPHIEAARTGYLKRGYLDPVQFVRGLPWETEWADPLREAWEVSAARVMRRAHRATKVRKELVDTGDEALSTQEELGLQFLEEQGAVLVQQLKAQNRKAMVEVLQRAIKEGWDIPKIVRNIKTMIGLLPSQARAAMNRQAALEAAGKSEKQVEFAVGRYKNRLLRYRAENIARTETVRALNAGQLEAWRAEEGSGGLPVGVKRIWIVAVDERTCPMCMELGAAGAVPLGQPWNTPLAGMVMAPPAHPSCRCSMGLV